MKKIFLKVKLLFQENYLIEENLILKAREFVK